MENQKEAEVKLLDRINFFERNELSTGRSAKQPTVRPKRQPSGPSSQAVDSSTILSAVQSTTQPKISSTMQSVELSPTQPVDHVENPNRLNGTVHCVLIFILRLCVYSPLKRTKDAFNFSSFHIFWFVFHTVKIAFLTQLIFNFGYCRETLASIVTDGYITLQHTLLKDWDANFQTMSYQPAHGQYASYSVEDLKNRIDYTIAKLYNIETETSGYFRRMPGEQVIITTKYYNIVSELNGKISKVNVEEPISFEPSLGLSTFSNTTNITMYEYDVTKDLDKMNLSTVLHRMLGMEVKFALYSLRIDWDSKETRCLHIDGTVSFINVYNNGQVISKLTTLTFPIKCDLSTYSISHCEKQDENDANAVKGLAWTTAVIDFIMFVVGIYIVIYFFSIRPKCCCCCWWWCSCSCNSCYRNGKRYSFLECFLTIQWWTAISVLADIFILFGIGEILKMFKGQLNKEDVPLRNWDGHVVMLGSGCLFAWFSFSRFFRMHYKFTLLAKTIRKSAVDIIFFLICVILIFVGFWTCSFIVLGPYHIKFKTKTTSSETLFSMINGDEIFQTFSLVQEEYVGDTHTIYVFSRILGYAFVSIFTIFVFNLLIAIFNNAYEVVKGKSNESNKEQSMDGNEKKVSGNKDRTLSELLKNCSPESDNLELAFFIFFPSIPCQYPRKLKNFIAKKTHTNCQEKENKAQEMCE